MNRFSRAFGYFCIGLGTSLVVGYWLKLEENRRREEDEHIVISVSEQDSISQNQETERIVISPPASEAANSSPPVASEDDLTLIYGIGAKTSETLHERGIYSFEQLGSHSAETLFEKLSDLRGMTLDKAATWIREANMLAGKA